MKKNNSDELICSASDSKKLKQNKNLIKAKIFRTLIGLPIMSEDFFNAKSTKMID